MIQNSNIQKIIEMQKAYDQFVAVMKELELEGNELVKKSLSRIDKEKISDVLQNIKKLS